MTAKPKKATARKVKEKTERARVTFSFFVRPTKLAGRFPNVDPETLASESDVGIPVPPSLIKLAKLGGKSVTLPRDELPDDRGKRLMQTMRKLFEHQIAVEEEVTLENGTVSWNPKGGPPWREKPIDGDSPSVVIPLRIGDVAEHPGEGRQRGRTGRPYSYSYRWYVVGSYSS
jgi:hypothetical protein